MMNTEVVRWGFMALARVTTFDEIAFQNFECG
jgi:hypothetical protein